jgi:two-component system chemotaxis sensor kinase CheA
VEAIDEIVAEFLVESHENLDQLDRDLLALEQNPNSRELLASVFRTIHTIKGTSGFLAFHRLEKLSHIGENLLSRLRDGRIQLSDQRATALLQMVDAIRGLLSDIEATGGEGDADHSELLETLASLLEDSAPTGAPTHAPARRCTLGRCTAGGSGAGGRGGSRARSRARAGAGRARSGYLRGCRPRGACHCRRCPVRHPDR